MAYGSLVCEHCGESFNLGTSDARQSDSFCSKACELEYYAACVEDHCEICGEFESECECGQESEASHD